jgi:hypothetical protein
MGLDGVPTLIAPDMAFDDFEMTLILLNNVKSMIDETTVKEMALMCVHTEKPAERVRSLKQGTEPKCLRTVTHLHKQCRFGLHGLQFTRWMLQKAFQVLPVWRQRTIGRNTGICLETKRTGRDERLTHGNGNAGRMPTETHQFG